MKLAEPKGLKLRWLGLPLAGILTACGGGSGGSIPQADGDATMTGSVFASSVYGATCEVKDLSGNVVAGPFVTSVDGGYSITIPSANNSEDLVVTCNGGTFTDEATGAIGQKAGAMSAYIKSGSAGSSVHVTPASTIIQQLIAEHDKTLDEALDAFEDAFGFKPDLSVKPLDATIANGNGKADSLLSGLRAAVFSQLAKDLQLTAEEQFELFKALAKDLSDGKLDGADALGDINVGDTVVKLPADIRNGYGRAMARFRESGRDKSGLANDKIGVLPFAKIALTDSYKVEYVPGDHGAVNGKTEFKLKITDNSDTPVSTNVGIKPNMYMPSMTHSTPSEGCSESETTVGEYNCTVYYLMPSVMMGGAAMGYWELNVMIDGHMGEKAYFYPTVTMAMGDTAQVRLKGQNDKISVGMMSGHGGDMKAESDMEMTMEQRTYFLFKRKLSGMGDMRNFEFYIAAKESMMSFPAVHTSGTLSADTMQALNLAGTSVEVSTNGTEWQVASEVVGFPGRWSASNLSGLVDEEEGNLFVRLTIDGEQKTTDGKAPNALDATDDNNNNYARFYITPGGMVMPTM